MAPPTQARPPRRTPPEFTWLDPGTWGAYKFVPAYVGLFAIAIGYFLASRYLPAPVPTLDISSLSACGATFNYNFRINAALHQSKTYSTLPASIAGHYAALMEIFSPDTSVFSPEPFPDGRVPSLARVDRAVEYVSGEIHTHAAEARGVGLLRKEVNEQAVMVPAELGVASLRVGQREKKHLLAAEKQRQAMMKVPTAPNGARSAKMDQLVIDLESFARAVPFLAYYAVVFDDLDAARDAVEQVKLYLEILRIDKGEHVGLWSKAVSYVGGGSAVRSVLAETPSLAVLAYGLAQVRATLSAWPATSTSMLDDIQKLDQWIEEIVSAVLRLDGDVQIGLLRRQPGNSKSQGEVTGTALFAATIYRMALLSPGHFGTKSEMIEWAHKARKAVVARVDEDGFVGPAAYAVRSNEEREVDVSAEAQSNLLLLGTAWRDCVCRGGATCREVYLEEMGMEIKVDVPFLESLTGRKMEEIGFESLFDIDWERLVPDEVKKWIDYFKAP